MVEHFEVFVCQPELGGVRGVDDGGGPASPGYGYYIRRLRQQPSECDTLGGRAVAIGDRSQTGVNSTEVGCRAATTERLVSEERDAELGTIRDLVFARSHRDRELVLNRGKPASSEHF